jgi:uncharacterized protein (UPF0276 family)
MAWSRLDLGVGLIAVDGVDVLWPAIADLVDVVEVEPQTLWDHAIEGQRIAASALEWLRSTRLPLLSHGVGFPVGGTLAPELAGVRASARSARDLDAVHWSEHLSFNRAGTGPVRHAGYLLPPIPTGESVNAAVGHIARFQDQFDRPFLVETPTSYLRPVPGDLTDGQFVAQIAQRADCGILLDLHNVWANELNGRQTVEQFLAEIPLERVWEVHLAGGHYLDELYLDAHVGPVPAPLLELAREVIPTLPRLRAILFEAVPESVAELGADGLAGLLTDLAELTRLPQRAVRPLGATMPAPACNRRDTAEREARLLAYTTRASGDATYNDPGADALRHLTDHARLSLLVAGHAADLRELLRENGRERTDELLRQFLAATPASVWPAEQSAAFADWWWARAAHPEVRSG